MTRSGLCDAPRAPDPDDSFSPRDREGEATAARDEMMERIERYLVIAIADIADKEGVTKLGGPDFDVIAEAIEHIIAPLNTNVMADAEKYLKEAKVL